MAQEAADGSAGGARERGGPADVAELVVEGAAADVSAARATSELEIVVGDVVIRAGAGADEGQLTRAIRAARASAS